MQQLVTPLIVLAAAAALFVLQQARELLLPVVLAVFLSLLLGRPVHALARRGVPRMLGALLVAGSFTAVLGFGIGQFIGPLEDWSARMPQALQVLQQHGAEFKDRLQRLSATQKQVQALASEVAGDEDRAVKVEVDNGGATEQAAGYLLALLSGFLVTMLLLFFLLARGNVLLLRIVQLGESHAVRRRSIHVARSVQAHFTRFLLTITAMNMALALATGTMLTVLGVPDAWLWGALAGVLNYAPYVGTVISATAITIAAAVSQETLPTILLPGCLYLLLNGLEAGMLTPALLGERLALNPLFVLLAIVFFGWLWGVAGMFVAVPMLVIGKVLLTEFGGRARPWARVLAG